jgi:hypothetical protein
MFHMNVLSAITGSCDGGNRLESDSTSRDPSKDAAGSSMDICDEGTDKDSRDVLDDDVDEEEGCTDSDKKSSLLPR